jgi:hypothetical protein
MLSFRLSGTDEGARSPSGCPQGGASVQGKERYDNRFQTAELTNHREPKHAGTVEDCLCLAEVPSEKETIANRS